MLQKPLHFNHDILKEYIRPGDHVIDATVGNGNDTVFLAQLVGKDGKVDGFDIQAQAIEETGKKLLLTGLAQQTTLHHMGHENIKKIINENHSIAVCMFNLGYLPKGDKSIITLPETTLSALEQCTALLRTKGVLSIMVYHGHPGGAEEKDAVLTFAQHLPQKEFTVYKYEILNQMHCPPFLLLIEKK
ncbi:tRNA (mnm(5)s(2)U34)-methyltransferase [Allofustis seminis]|uniref:tRNA (mnm(5)s(2)U34)-methyltransferase n=1 Tax=Allofustis seminis TaxID=166939 RepID=UPI00036583B2|nr:class I SAM-dependent methyltransferase [Allofustis seminis]